ncbi:MAG: Asp-tRNA(Asn)/Glu-tRNA(Gln) amidotransferase subunit GatB [bacterium]|nr:Asp-tRNA(Asn)/Glu-tRNA(Gln) amidotransferase subunit GatB [bacterium]
MQYEPVIGLEIHTELKTKTKMFCYSLNDPNERHPNVNICPVCMGYPGTLPTINAEAVKKVVMVGLALGGKINKFSQFDRKSYFYPDLPKGYQISQYKHPLVEGGRLGVEGREIRIRRIHLEEDTGRLIHDSDKKSSLVDFNRAGVPLMELVTEPDFRSAKEVVVFGEEFQKILRYLEASDANMEKGQLRLEVNMSLRPVGEERMGTKVELKNINSFKYAADAIEYEIKRQTEVLNSGEKIIHETRGWNEHKKETFSQRTKEEEHDYRYFPEPDLPPLEFTPEQIDEWKVALPELPASKRGRFVKEYGLEPAVAEVLIRDKYLAGYFESVVSELRQEDIDTPEKPKTNLEKLIASFLTGDFLALLNEKIVSITEVRITPENMAELILYLAEDKISNLAAKQVLAEMFAAGEDPSVIIEKLGLWQISRVDDLEDIAKHIIKENPKAVEDYKKGKEASLQFLVGQVMKESRGKANPKVVGDVLINLLRD